MNPWQGTAPLRRMATAAIAAAVLLVLMAGSASAAESTWPTAQAVAANADWVPYLDPPEKPAAICLVDSGVNVTPDTPADSPDGPIVKRLALDGGTGEAAGTSWEALHGTRMAMVAGAPKNDWGTIGMWPGVRIVSVRAMPTGETTFPFDNYQESIRRCEQAAAVYTIVAVNLSLGCACDYSPNQNATLENRIAHAHGLGISVVASAGNEGGAVAAPASQAGVLGAGASSSIGALCPFSGRGPGMDLVLPGCGMSLADPQNGTPWTEYSGGTSAAAAQASTLLAVLRAYLPDLRWNETEAFLQPLGDAPAPINVEDVFRKAGLGALVDRARARESRDRQTTTTMPADEASAAPSIGPTAPEARSPSTPNTAFTRDRPHIQLVRWKDQRLQIAVSNRGKDARLVVLVQKRAGEFRFVTIARRSAVRSHLSIHLRYRPARILVSFESNIGTSAKSNAVERRI